MTLLNDRTVGVLKFDSEEGNAMNGFDEDSLLYHANGRPGKIEVVASKPCRTDRALSLAYTPGVAAPCRVIAKHPDMVYDYTAKGNLVAVITNGTAVLGLGNIGPLASKPVMEGKALLFKQFADIDVFDLEMQTDTIEDLITSIKALEPTFGGINLEDIRAPECFIVEEALKKALSIPVLHDDQHGTAIVVSAALTNACLLTQRDLKSLRIVFSGAGAAAIACARLFLKLGIDRSQITMCDIDGMVYTGRKANMDAYKGFFAQDTNLRSLGQALAGADVFIGLSAGGVVTREMLKGLNDKPIIFVLANPTPEIDPRIALEIFPNAIIATGRSDFPNQVNNLLGFPYIFRGALDVRATSITEEMKLAAVYAIAALAREDVPDSVSSAYGNLQFQFGPNYILPKPFDPRVLLRVAPAVAQAAMDCGVARKPILDFEAYKDRLDSIQGPKKSFIRDVVHRLQTQQQKSNRRPRIIFPEGEDIRILKALNLAAQEHLIEPILLGSMDVILGRIKELGLTSLTNYEIVDPLMNTSCEASEYLYLQRQRKGITQEEAHRLAKLNGYFAAIELALGKADGLIAGATERYSNCLVPIFQMVGAGKSNLACGLNLVLFKGRVLFFADTSINKCPDAEQLSIIAIHVAKTARFFGVEPKIAMLSYSNFYGNEGIPAKMKKAADLVRENDPTLSVDGEMQADTAVNADIVDSLFPFCKIENGANVLIFPNLESGNIAYKLLQQLGGGEVLGPYIIGLKRPANIIPRTSSVEDIFNFITMTALQANETVDFLTTKDSHSKSNQKTLSGI